MSDQIELLGSPEGFVVGSSTVQPTKLPDCWSYFAGGLFLGMAVIVIAMKICDWLRGLKP